MFLKRLFDFTAALLMLLLLSPVLIVITLLIKLTSRGPVFFLQERAGRYGRAFTIYKFRTMVVGAEKIGDGVYTGANDARITRVGNFLRAWSLDELPQLLNILTGDMSIIGPRPTLMYQIEEYDEFQKQRLLARPGVTGWAQVNGRNSLTWPERITLDVWYVENWSLWLDLKILFKTVAVVFKREGIYAEKSNFVIRDGKELNQ
jgi:undecaprenyl phosphate N,N'-diacetylbacillosamine 1-phosphate transferase